MHSDQSIRPYRRIRIPINRQALFLFLLSFSLNLIMCVYRRTDAFTYPQFWAEDGNIFFASSYYEGIRSLFIPYSGYLHLYPRLTALFGYHFVPLDFIPAFYNLSWILALLMVNIYLISRLPFEPGVRFFMAISICFTPVADEVFVNATNAQWILSLSIILYLISSEPSSAIHAVFETAILLTACLSGPFIILYMPLIVLRYALKNSFTKYDALLLSIFIISFFIQCMCMYIVPHGQIHDNAITITDAGIIIESILVYISKQYASLIGFYRFCRARPFSVPFSIIVILFQAALIIHALRKKDTIVLYSLSAGMLIVLSTLMLYGKNMVHLDPKDGGTRYFYLPAVMAIWALVSMAYRYLPKRILPLSFAFIMFSVIYTHEFKSAPLIDYNWREQARKLMRGEVISVNPPGFDFKLYLRDSDLDTSRRQRN